MKKSWNKSWVKLVVGCLVFAFFDSMIPIAAIANETNKNVTTQATQEKTEKVEEKTEVSESTKKRSTKPTGSINQKT